MVLDQGLDPFAYVDTVAAELGARPLHVYQHALNGFVVELPAAALNGLSHRPGVAWVEPDQVVSIADHGPQHLPTGLDRIEADRNPMTGGLISMYNPLQNATFMGADVDIAIVDTGVQGGHPDLNLYAWTDCSGAIFYPLIGGCAADSNPTDEDGHGHGTHVAGIAAAIDNGFGVVGVAPGARLWSVKVLNADGSGYLGAILAGVDAITRYAAQIEVANMSLGGVFASAALDTAIANSVNAGVLYAVAGGNSTADAATFSPANHPDVVAVSALADFDGLPGGLGAQTCRTDVDDTFADFSNYGAVIDLAAPGACIYSTYRGSAYTTMSGTSMATPYVTGAAARHIAETGVNPANRTQVMALRSTLLTDALAQTSPCGFTGDPDAFPEPLLFLNGPGFGSDGAPCTAPPPPPPNNPPVASFSSSCTDLTCTFTSTSTDPDDDSLTLAWDFGDTATAAGSPVAHTYGTAGNYTVTLTANDGRGGSDTTSNTVTVTAPAASLTVKSIVVTPVTTRRSNATVTIVDNLGVTVASATVNGHWVLGTAIRTRTGTTGSTGTVTFSSGSYARGTSPVRFCVDGVTKSGYVSFAGPTCSP